jgi:hypothetical protein
MVNQNVLIATVDGGKTSITDIIVVLTAHRCKAFELEQRSGFASLGTHLDSSEYAWF